MNQPIFIASEKVHWDLSHCDRLPPNLLGNLSAEDIRQIVHGNLNIPSSYWSVKSEFFFEESREGLTREFFDRFLSMLSDRSIVYLDVVKSGECSKSLEKYRLLCEKLSCQQMGQHAATHTFVVIVDGTLTDEDKESLNSLHDSRLARIYLMEGELDSCSANLPSVHSGNVWSSAVPQLLVRLIEYPQTHGNQSNFITAWRSVVIEPNLLNQPVLDIYDRWVQETVLSSTEKFEETPFSVALIETTLGNQSNSFQLDFTAEYKQKNAFVKKVENYLKQKDAGDIRRNAAEALRVDVVNASGMVASAVRKGEISSWRQAHNSPSLVRTMSKSLSSELTSQEQLLSSDSEAWKILLQQLAASDKKIREASRAAKVLDKARAHLISWDMRLLLCCVSILIVFYLVFVMLKPSLSVIFDNWTFWFACALGVAGAVAAAFVSFFYEVQAGKNGAKFVADKVLHAHKSNSTKATMEYLVKINKDKQRISWINTLDNTIRFAKRLGRMIDSVTRSEIDDSVIHKDTNEMVILDKKIHSDGSRIIIGGQESHLNIEHAKVVMDTQENEFKRTLNAAWSELAMQCDEKNRGSFPLDSIRRYWGNAIVDAWSKFRMEVIEHIVEEWRSENVGNSDELAQKIRKRQGFAVSDRPFISTKLCSDEQIVRFLFARDAQLISSIKPVLEESADAAVLDQISSKLPYFAMVFEEMSVDLGLGGSNDD